MYSNKSMIKINLCHRNSIDNKLYTVLVNNYPDRYVILVVLHIGHFNLSYRY